MHIVISDDYQDCIRSLDAFALTRGHQVTIHHDTVTDLDALAERFAPADAIVLIRERTRITDELLARLPRLRIIAQTGKVAGHIDLEACKRRGVRVTEGQGAGTATVELTLLLILASLRNLVAEANHLREGGWQRSLGHQLAGRTLGILGFGRIGSQVARIGGALGAKVLVGGRPSTLKKAVAAGFDIVATQEELLERSDVLSIHLRLTPETKHLLGSSDLARMRPGSLLVNTSRAEIIAPGALEQALNAGRPGRAAVDVFEEEPVLGARHPLVGRDDCLCTPHIGFVERDNYEAYFHGAFESINACAP